MSPGSRTLNEALRTFAVLFVCAMCVAATRGRLFRTHKKVKEKHDTYFLPPQEHVAMMTLGHRAAAADAIWAHILVAQGLHTFSQRRFENLNGLYEVVLYLDPTWKTPYRLADALITFQGAKIPYEDVVFARRILERGREQTRDPDIILNLGQFVSFVAPSSYLDEIDPKIAERWRKEGIPYLQEAASMGAGTDSHLAWQSLGGASILAKTGELDAAIRYYERAYVVSDDPELKAHIRQLLAKYRASLQQEIGKMDAKRAADAQRAMRSSQAYLGHDAKLREIVRAELPTVKRDRSAVLGPPVHAAACAGPGHSDEADCATDWRAWFERRQEAFDAAASK